MEYNNIEELRERSDQLFDKDHISKLTDQEYDELKEISEILARHDGFRTKNEK